MKSPREVIESHYAAGELGDLPGMMADFAPDIVWTEAAGFPVAGTYVGPDSVRDNGLLEKGDSVARPPSKPAVAAFTPTADNRPAGEAAMPEGVLREPVYRK